MRLERSIVALVVLQAAAASAAPFAWLASYSAGTVARIDLASHTTVSIAAGGQPFTTAASLDGLRAYAANGDHSLAVVDAPSATLLTTIPLGFYPIAVAVRADGAKVYVPTPDGSIAVVDAATTSVVDTIPIATGASFGAIVTNAVGTRAYVTKSEYPQSSVAVLDTVADTFTGDVLLDGTGGGFPLGVAVSPDGTRVYATVYGIPAVFVVDATTNLATGSIPLDASFGTPQPNGLAVSPDGSRVYVTETTTDRLAILDATTLSEITSVAVGSSPTVVDLTPDGARAYVVNQSSSSLSILDTATNTVVGTVLTVDEFPGGGERFIAPGTTTTTTSTTAVPTTSSTSTTAPAATTTSSTSTTIAAATTTSTIPPPPALSSAGLACQKTLALSFKRFGAKAHGVFVSCFQRLLGDVASGSGTASAAAACAATLDPALPTAKIARLRTAATAQILARCANLTPADVAHPCSPTATTMADVADCVLDAQIAGVAATVAAEYGGACTIATAAGLTGLHPNLCAP
jgi:YVTN family beta-propeller protein